MSKIIGRPLYAPAPAGGASPQLPELAGTWVLNDRLYAPENAFDVYMNYTFTIYNTLRQCTRIRIYNNSLAMTASGIGEQSVYNFADNRWNGSNRTMKISDGATAPDEFRAWLASNATKQTA